MKRMVLAVAFALAAAQMACVAGAEESGVKVSSFGWDPQDSTRFIQAALDSDAPVIILDRQAGPWMTLPLRTRSNKTVIFEPGVELQAKKGAFRGIHDSLFSIEKVENVKLIGSGGARMKMHKADYQKPPYERSEWRFALRIVSSTNVYVKGLSFVESGGDGILVSRNARNVTLLDCICDGNHRQGISVIGAQNLLIENCIMRNTSGTPPQAGIDFEPDHANQPLINCVMRNCLVENNGGSGYEFYLGNLTAATAPLSVLIENCRSVGNARSANVNFGYTKPTRPKGCITFRDCTFDAPRGSGIVISSKPANAARVTFERCTVNMGPANAAPPVMLESDARWDMEPVDNVELKDITVKLSDGGSTNWVACSRSKLCPTLVTDLSGSVRVVRPGGVEEKVALDAAWVDAHLKPASARALPTRVQPDKASWKGAKVFDSCPDRMVELSRAWIPWKGRSHYVFYAPQKGPITFAGRTRASSSKASAKSLVGGIRISYSSGRGKELSVDAPGDKTAEFTVCVPRAGFYEMKPKIGAYGFLLERSSVPVAIDTCRKHATLEAEQSPLSLWFAAPRGTAQAGPSEFNVVARGGTHSGSTVEAALFSPDGEMAAQGVGSREWAILAGVAKGDALWRLELKKVPTKPYSVFSLDMAGLPGVFFLSSEKTWRFQ